MLLGAAVDGAVLGLQKVLEGLAVGTGRREAVARVAADAAAGRFHLSEFGGPPPVVVLGGTGTGKSTIINRIVEANVCAASFRRTFTAGAVAVVAAADQVPPGWLGIARRIVSPGDLPVCGAGEALTIAPTGGAGGEGARVRKITLVDSPDLDGDRPAHHAQADRAFRWARAVVFVVTPEKYQMTELLPYYRLARRYGLPALFVMNKCEEAAVVADYAAQLAGREWADAKVFVIPRDDAAYEPPGGSNLRSLREALGALGGNRVLPSPGTPREGQGEGFLRQASNRPSPQPSPGVPGEGVKAGLARRMQDLVTRATDQVLSPLRQDRAAVDRLTKVLREMTAPSPGVDVSPVTAAAQRRFQQRSVLYLMGPQRMLDRLRQLPMLALRLPRGVWDTVVRGQKPSLPDPAGPKDALDEVADLPDFGSLLAEQLRVFHSRLDDLLRSDPAARAWIESSPDSYKDAFVPVEQASGIAADELNQLRQWVEANWSATPRDTAILMKALKRLPGGGKLVKLFEASPYLFFLIADLATHGVVTPSIMIANYLFGTWVSENVVNEVKVRTRTANRQIAERFDELAARQVDRVLAWLEKQAPAAGELKRLETEINRLAEAIPEDLLREGVTTPRAPSPAFAAQTLPSPGGRGEVVRKGEDA